MKTEARIISRQTDRQRNLGLDICRVLSMLGIVMLHVLGQGGVLNAARATNGVSYWVAYYMEIVAMCSVDIYAVLSGYFGYGKHKQKSYRLFELVSIVVFYSVLITVVLYIINPSLFDGIMTWLKSFVPPLAGRYWYITCFIPILAFQPLLNKTIDSLTVKQHGLLSTILLVIFSVIPSVIPIDFFKLSSGYSCAWLLICYVIGTFLRRFDLYETIKRYKGWLVVTFFGLALILLGGNILVNIVVGKNGYMVSYISPVTLLMAFCVIAMFDDIKITGGQKIILFLSAMSFDVYQIHSHNMLYDNYIAEAFSFIGKMSVFLIPFAVILSCVAIYLVSSVIGYIRSVLYKATRFDKLLLLIASKYDKLCNKMIVEESEDKGKISHNR